MIEGGGVSYRATIQYILHISIAFIVRIAEFLVIVLGIIVISNHILIKNITLLI